MNDIEKINDVDQSFTADFIVATRWRDLRLARPGSVAALCQYPLQNIWNPQVHVWNKRNVQKHLPDIVRVARDGTVEYTQRYYARLSSPIDLREFPFDRQKLPISLLSIEYGPDDLSLSLDDAGQGESFSLAGWSTIVTEAKEEILHVKSTQGGAWDETFARLDYLFAAWRNLEYYFWKVVVPLTVIVIMSWAVFWIDPDQLGVQIGVATTSILTLIAFLFSLRALLPPVSYLTRIDTFIYGSLVLVFLALLEGMITCTMGAHDKAAITRRIDWWCRGLFPSAFMILMLWFWLR